MPSREEIFKHEQEQHINGRNSSMKTDKPIIYIDLDGVCADYNSYFADQYLEHGREMEDIFLDKEVFNRLSKIDGCVKAVRILNNDYDLYFLSTPIWQAPDSYTDKRLWISKVFGNIATNKLILSHNKGLLKGDYLIDDTKSNGVGDFEGEHLWFGQDYKNWDEVLLFFDKISK